MQFPLLNPSERGEFDLRITKVREMSKASDYDAILISSSVNIYYLTGGICRGYLYLPMNDEPKFFVIPPAEADKPIMESIRKPEQICEKLIESGYQLPRRLGLEFDDLYYSEVERLAKCFKGAEITNCSGTLRGARVIKTPQEIKKMEEDGKRQSAVYSKIPTVYRAGMTDLEFQIEIERILRLEGCLGYLRVSGSKMEINMGSVICGDNADATSPYDFSMGGSGIDTSLPVGADNKEMRPGQCVMVDMNGGFNGYQTDMTRCWAIGEIREDALKAHECSRAILRELETYARPGVEIGELYRLAVRIADDTGLADYFMGHRHKVAFIGHGVGIELNELPVIMNRNKSLLEENMTLAIEPKFVLPGIGALGVENTYQVTPAGLRNLTVCDEELRILN